MIWGQGATPMRAPQAKITLIQAEKSDPLVAALALNSGFVVADEYGHPIKPLMKG